MLDTSASHPTPELEHLLQQIERLEALVAERQRTEAQFQGLWESAPDANLLVDQGLIRLANSRALSLFGYRREELIGQSIDKLIPERYRARHAKYIDHYSHNPQSRPMGHGPELFAKTKQGNEIPVEISLSSLQFEAEKLVICTIRDIRERKRALEMISRQSRALMELSTPVIELIEGLLLLPLIGVVDTLRAQQIMENLLQSIVAHHTRVVLLDITGVPVIDTQVARHLIQTVAAAHLLGAEVMLTGLSPESAQVLVTLGIDLPSVHTLGSLQSGIRAALQLLGKEISDQA